MPYKVKATFPPAPNPADVFKMEITTQVGDAAPVTQLVDPVASVEVGGIEPAEGGVLFSVSYVDLDKSMNRQAPKSGSVLVTDTTPPAPREGEIAFEISEDVPAPAPAPEPSPEPAPEPVVEG